MDLEGLQGIRGGRKLIKRQGQKMVLLFYCGMSIYGMWASSLKALITAETVEKPLLEDALFPFSQFLALTSLSSRLSCFGLTLYRLLFCLDRAF